MPGRPIVPLAAPIMAPGTPIAASLVRDIRRKFRKAPDKANRVPIVLDEVESGND